MKRMWKSFGHGLRGIGRTFLSEPNMRIHAVCGLVVVAAGIGFRVSRMEWLALVLCIGGVLAAECANTAIERLADRVTSEHDPLIGQAKDAAAGAVMLASVTAAVVGSLVFGPKLWEIFGEP